MYVVADCQSGASNMTVLGVQHSGPEKPYIRVPEVHLAPDLPGWVRDLPQMKFFGTLEPFHSSLHLGIVLYTMGPPSTKPRNRRHHSELACLNAFQAAEKKQHHCDAKLETLVRTCKERKRQQAACVSGSTDTCWTGVPNAHNISNLA